MREVVCVCMGGGGEVLRQEEDRLRMRQKGVVDR